MSPTRREFIQSLGVTLASLVLTRCGPTPDPAEIIQCYVQVDPPTPAIPSIAEKGQVRQRVRGCWLRLDWLTERAQMGTEEAKQAKDELATEHRAALDELVDSGEMTEDVAHHVQLAFLSAVDHVAPPDLWVTCYEPVVVEADATPTPTPPVDQAARQIVTDYAGGSGRRLTQQAVLLAEVAGTSSIKPDTVERAQSAIQRDMMLLSSTDHQDLIARLVKASGGTYDFPPIHRLDLDTSPEAAEAAHFLVELLLEE